MVLAEDIEGATEKLIARAELVPESFGSAVTGGWLLEPDWAFVQRTGLHVARAVLEVQESTGREVDAGRISGFG